MLPDGRILVVGSGEPTATNINGLMVLLAANGARVADFGDNGALLVTVPGTMNSRGSADVLVLGGGPAGVAAAWWSARAGRSVVLLERASAVGGLAASFEVAGVRVDHGSHRLHPSTPAPILAELQSLLGTDLQRRRRHGRIHVADRWLRFPPSPAEVLARAPRRLAVGLARDLVLAPLRRPRRDTYAEVVRAGVGPTLATHLYHPFAEKLWGLAPDELAGEQARRRIRASSPFAVARRALRPGRPPEFLYPRRGFGQIAEAIAEAAMAAGATIRTDAEVVDVNVTADRCAVVTTADGSVFEANVVLSTIPLAALVGRLLPAAPAEVEAATRRQQARGMALVYLALDRRQWTEFDAHYLPSRDVIASRVSEPRNYRDGDDPPDRTVLCAEVPCSVGDPGWSTSDDDLVDRVVDDLARLDLPTVSPVDSLVRRVPSVYPVYRPGFEVDLALVERWVDELGPVTTLGRQGLVAHDNTHHTLEMAWQAVAALTDTGVDRGRWQTAREQFRSHVVED